LQGRLVGKRTTGRFFLEQVAEHGTENCDYLIATDFDDVAVPGYRFASYDLGYGDMLARADFSTIRITPWVPKTALILCDLLLSEDRRAHSCGATSGIARPSARRTANEFGANDWQRDRVLSLSRLL